MPPFVLFQTHKQIVRIAQAGGHEEIRGQNTGKWLAMSFFVTVFVVLYAILWNVL
jgi:hypothetical protein